MKKTISFVIPVYNEEARLGKTFEALSALTLPRGLTLEKIIFVDDGSCDATLSILFERSRELTHSSALNTVKDAKIQIISYRKNQGKGYALRTGMLASDSDYTLFFDADISTPLSEISKLMPFVKRNVDIIIGTRKNGGSTVIKHQPIHREILGKGFTKMTQFFLGLTVTDFTCGFKAFSRASLLSIFSKSVINRWGYDAELVFLASKMRFSIAEQAVIWANDERTKVRLSRAIPQTIAELAKIRWTHTVRPLFFFLIPPLFKRESSLVVKQSA